MTVENTKIKSFFRNIQVKVNKRNHLKPVDEWSIDGNKRSDQRIGGIFREASGRSLKDHILPDN